MTEKIKAAFVGFGEVNTPVEDFARNVMSQHYIITYGNNYSLLKDLCLLKNIEVV